MLSCSPCSPVNDALRAVQHRVVRAEERHGLLVHAILRVRGLQKPSHHDLGRVVAHRQVVGEVLADLIPILGRLHRTQLLVARELELGARHQILRRRFFDRLHRRLELHLTRLELLLGGLQHLQREDFGFLQRTAKILIGA